MVIVRALLNGWLPFLCVVSLALFSVCMDVCQTDCRQFSHLLKTLPLPLPP